MDHQLQPPPPPHDATNVGYNASYKQSHFMRPKKLLILLDMNGTLLVRSKKLIGGVRSHMKAEGRHYYFREGFIDLFSLLCRLQRQGLLVFCFYTSMTMKYAYPAVEYIISCVNRRHNQEGDFFEEPLPFIYDQQWNLNDPTPEDRFGFKRNLPLLWTNPAGPAFGFAEFNTIMLDDSTRKMRDFPYNLLLVPEFTEFSDLGDTRIMQVVIDIFSSIVRTWIARQGFQQDLFLLLSRGQLLCPPNREDSNNPANFGASGVVGYVDPFGAMAYNYQDVRSRIDDVRTILQCAIQRFPH